MKKKILLLLMLFACVATSRAQLAKWGFRPAYESVRAMDGDLYKVEKGGKFGLMHRTGRSVLPVQYDSICAFRDGYAVLYDKAKQSLVGYTDVNGKVVEFKDKTVLVDNGFPYFMQGYLMVWMDGYYWYVKGATGEFVGPFFEASPFFCGVARVVAFEDPRKQKGPYNTYMVAETGQTMLFPQDVDEKDINFLSSAAYDQAIMIYKKNVYKFNVKTKAMDQLFTTPDRQKKTEVKAKSSDIVRMVVDREVTVSCKNADFVFDEFLRLKSSQYLGQDVVTSEIEKLEWPQYTSQIEAFRGAGKYGLNYRGNLLLPAQFDDVTGVRNDDAIIVNDGQYGLVIVEPDYFTFKMNDYREIGFTKDSYKTRLTMIMPPYIKCAETTVESKSYDCEIAIETYDAKETPKVNSISYDCNLLIPENITDSLTDIPYQFAVTYEGLKSKDYEIKVPMWYVNNYQLEMLQQYVIDADSTLYLEFKIYEDKSVENRFKTVTIETQFPYRCESVPTKVTEEIYSCTIKGVVSGDVPFRVKVKEGRCPDLEFDESVYVPAPSATQKRSRQQRNIDIEQTIRKAHVVKSN